MKPTKYFNITVPELGDKPDITQVSNAIQDLEDALAGTTELMEGTVNNKVLTLVSSTRTTKRTSYHKGMSVLFIAKSAIEIGGVTSVKIDDLPSQSATINFTVDIGETAMLYYDGSKFLFQYMPIPKSPSVSSTSTSTVATSSAVKQAYDKGVDALNKANTMTPNGGYGGTANDLANNKADKSVIITAGNGLTGGGNLSTSRTINVASADDGITVNADNIKLNIIDSVTSTSKTRPASGNAVKTANDNANGRVSKSGDTMTGNLSIKTNNYPSLHLDNTANGYNKALRIEHSQANLLRFIKYTDIGAGTQDEALNWDMSASGTIYHTGNKPTAADVGALSINGGGVKGTIQIMHGDPFLSFLSADGNTSYGYIGSQGNTDDSLYYRVPGDNAIRAKIYHERNKPTPQAIGALTNTTINSTDFDFNTIQASGMYNSGGDGNTATWKNAPVGGGVGWTWLVLRQLGSRTLQIAWSQNKMYSRYQNDNAGVSSWSRWVKYASSGTDSATRLFSGASQFGQNAWKDSGISIDRKYSFVYFRASSHGTDAIAFATSSVPTSLLRAIDGVPISPESSTPAGGLAERFRVKILNDKLHTLCNGGGSIADNYLLEVWGVEL